MKKYNLVCFPVLLFIFWSQSLYAEKKDFAKIYAPDYAYSLSFAPGDHGGNILFGHASRYTLYFSYLNKFLIDGLYKGGIGALVPLKNMRFGLGMASIGIERYKDMRYLFSWAYHVGGKFGAGIAINYHSRLAQSNIRKNEMRMGFVGKIKFRDQYHLGFNLSFLPNSGVEWQQLTYNMGILATWSKVNMFVEWAYRKWLYHEYKFGLMANISDNVGFHALFRFPNLQYKVGGSLEINKSLTLIVSVDVHHLLPISPGASILFEQ